MKRLIAEHEKRYHSVNNGSKFFFALTGRMGGKTAMQEMFIDEPKEAWKPKVGDEVWWDGAYEIFSGAWYQHKEGKAKYVCYNGGYIVFCGGQSYGTTIDHLSPLPKPKPEHYDGEPCELPVSPESDLLGTNLRFEYTGECGVPAEKWAVTDSNRIMHYLPRFFGIKRWILRAIPIDPGQSRLNEIHRTIAKLLKEAQELVERMKK
jgi:hypothetical protein